MKNQKGASGITVLIVVLVLIMVALITIPAIMRVQFKNYFGFDPDPKTPLKAELVYNHLSTIGGPCVAAERREREFNELPTPLTPKQTAEWEALNLRSRSLSKEAEALCVLHTRAVLRAKRFGYIGNPTDLGGPEQGGAQ